MQTIILQLQDERTDLCEDFEAELLFKCKILRYYWCSVNTTAKNTLTFLQLLGRLHVHSQLCTWLKLDLVTQMQSQQSKPTELG